MSARNNLLEHQLFTRNFALKLFYIFTLLFKILFVIPYLLLLQQAGKIWTDSDDLNYTNLDLCDKTPAYYFNHFWYIVSAIFKRGAACETKMYLKSIYHKASIFHNSKKYSSLTLETKFMGDLTCLFRDSLYA